VSATVFVVCAISIDFLANISNHFSFKNGINKDFSSSVKYFFVFFESFSNNFSIYLSLKVVFLLIFAIHK
jgi:hypothetical protein